MGVEGQDGALGDVSFPTPALTGSGSEGLSQPATTGTPSCCFFINVVIGDAADSTVPARYRVHQNRFRPTGSRIQRRERPAGGNGGMHAAAAQSPALYPETPPGSRTCPTPAERLI